MRSPSRGRIHVKSKDPRQPQVSCSTICLPTRREEFRSAIRALPVKFSANRHLLHIVAKEFHQVCNIKRAQLDSFVRQFAETAFHPSCSNKMGSDDMAVVDNEGRVHGMEGLRVVDHPLCQSSLLVT